MKSTVSTHEKLNPEVVITCSNKLNRNDIKSMEVKKETVTNIKEEDEVYIPIVKDLC